MQVEGETMDKKQNRKQGQPVTARVKLTLHTEERFFGPGVCELLEKIRAAGSIQAAAAEMKMSYTKAWKILNLAEREMGASLIIRTSGGKKGGSSILTEAGERAVHDFREMEAKVSEYACTLLQTYRHAFINGGQLNEPGSGSE